MARVSVPRDPSLAQDDRPGLNHVLVDYEGNFTRRRGVTGQRLVRILGWLAVATSLGLNVFVGVTVWRSPQLRALLTPPKPTSELTGSIVSVTDR